MVIYTTNEWKGYGKQNFIGMNTDQKEMKFISINVTDKNFLMVMKTSEREIKPSKNPGI